MKNTHVMRVGFILLLSACLPVCAEVPPPSETPVKIIVSGRTSTAVDIRIVKVGQEIPKTYADNPIGNTDGFEWYVSEHYALKSQMDEHFSRMVLEISELALPHWEEMTGLKPPYNETTRMGIVYARSAAEIVRVIQGDLGFTWSVNGGGVTWWGAWAAYNYPSGALQYHLKDLMIHENLHMLQGVVTKTDPDLMINMGTEGFTYGGAQHVYDSDKKQLTVQVFDAAPINHWTDSGVAQLQKDFIPIHEMIKKQWNEGGALGAVYSHFFWSDPERWFKWCIWRDEYYRGRVTDATNMEVMEDIFGSLDTLNKVWKDWVSRRRITFHHVDWGWEQNGNMLTGYGFPWDNKYWSQMDVQYAPEEKVEYDPLRMDYPAEPMPPIVGPVKRGVKEPSVGYVIGFSGSRDYWGGLGLGLEPPRSMCMVLISAANTLVIEGKDMPVPRREFPLPPEVKDAAARDNNRFGVTIQIRKDELEVTVRAGKPDAMKEMKVSVPLEAEVRQRLMSRYMSLVTRGGYHQITPFIDDARRMPPDLTVPAPANRWRFAGDRELYRLYRTAWRMKEQTPASLTRLKAKMTASMDKGRDAQKAAMKKYRKKIERVRKDVLNVSGAAGSDGLEELMGLSLWLAVDSGVTSNSVSLSAAVKSDGFDRAAGTIETYVTPAGILGRVQAAKSIEVLPGRDEKIVWTWEPPADAHGDAEVTVVAKVTCAGIPLTLKDSITFSMRPSIPRWLTIGPFDNNGDGTVDTAHPPETEPFDPEQKYAGRDGREIGWEKRERNPDLPVTSEFLLDFASLYGGENVAAYALTWICSPVETNAMLALGSDDGVVVWLNGERVHSNMVGRGYTSKQDRVPVHLKAGRNKLFVKVAQGVGEWSLCAHILNEDGVIMPGMIYELSGVPSPRELPAKVIVSGNISTVKDIGIVPVGLEIPVTYSGTAVRNTPGFSWWVSEHYALKTDYDADLAEFYLTLLELAYPHYVELFGGEPEGIENTRMTAVYASSGAQLEIAMASDGINWTYPGGGITYDTSYAAYQFQCYPVEFVWDQPRYILLHECAHLFQICMYGSLGSTPYWYYEGVADRIANHVYDPDRNQMTVNVFDKAGPLHFPDTGLDKIRQSRLALEDLIPRNCLGDRGVNVVVCTFLNSTPDLMQKFRLWRDAIIAHGGDVCATMEECFGPWQKLNSEFDAWIDARQTTFWTEGRQWSQGADTLWATASQVGSTNWSFKEVNLPPGRQADPDPWRLDHPAQDMPSIVGPVKRGVAEPSVGCVVDLSKGPDSGRAGMALGVVRAGETDEGMLKLLISAEHALVIDGETIGISNFTEVFPNKIKRAMVAGGHRAGITAVIGRKELRVIVRARDPEASKDVSFKTNIPLSKEQRDRLLKMPLGLLAQGGHHGVTHFFNPGRMPLPDLLVPASPDPWRNSGDKQLYSLYRTERELGDKTPHSLLELKQEMLDAADKDRAAQHKALDLYNKRLPGVVDDVGSCGAVSEIRETAFELLTGVSLEVDISTGDGPSEALVSATIQGPKSGEATGTVVIAGNFMPEQVSESVRCGAGEKAVFRRVGRVADLHGPVSAQVRADLVWNGSSVVLTDAHAVNTSIPRWLTIGPFDNKGDGTVDTAHPPETEPFDPEQKYTGKDGKEVGWEKRERSPDLPVTSEFLLNFASLYGGENVAAYALTSICSPVETNAVLALGSDDGVVVWLNGERVHSNMVGRGYSSKQDRVQVHLKAGRNKLLVKVAQGVGEWSLCAHILSDENIPFSYDIPDA